MLIDEHQLPVQRACRVVRLSRTAYYRPPPPQMRTDAPVIAALMTVVAAHGRWGFWKCFDRLRLDGRPWNHKRVHRVYCALRLNLPRRIKRRVPTRLRQPLYSYNRERPHDSLGRVAPLTFLPRLISPGQSNERLLT